MQTTPRGSYAAVLGSPIEHSLSPTLHTAAYQVLGLDWRYEKFEVAEAGLEAFIESLEGDCRGLSLTMPLKNIAFDLANVRDDASNQTRVCNTLILRDAVWHGFNTDVPGFVTALSRAGIAAVENATVLGAGATARSAIAALIRIGMSHVDVVARKPAQVAALAALFPEVEVHSRNFEESLPTNSVLVSTLPAGAADLVSLTSAVDVVFDVVYAPWPTRLALASSGRLVLGGLDLLVGQAVEQVLLMTQADPALRSEIYDAMYSAGLAEQVRRSS